MSSDIIKFKFIIKMIESIQTYINKYNAISIMLKDDMAFNATLLCLLQIGETLNKIKNQSELTQSIGCVLYYQAPNKFGDVSNIIINEDGC